MAKLTKSQIRSELPGAVRDVVLGLMSQYRTRRVSLEIKPEGWQLYLAEGCRYTAIVNGKTSTVQMMSQDSLHAGGRPQEYAVGKRINVPQGAWVVEFQLFLGTPFITVYNVSHRAIGAGGS